MKSLLVGVPTYNGARRVMNLFRSIEKANDFPEGYKVDFLIIDDGSHEYTRQQLHRISGYWNIPILFHLGNKGISASWNSIGNFGNSDFIIWLNDDLLVSKNWLTSMIYFLEKNNSAGAIGWNFMFIVERDVDIILESEKPVYIRRDPITKEYLSDEKPPFDAIPGKMMCAVGCCFAMTREKYLLLCNYNKVGGFDEEMKSFHEESDAFTFLSSIGFPSFMLPYPYLYHIWGQTFAENPELNAVERMKASREIYCRKWKVPMEFASNPFKFVDPIVMNRISKSYILWLDENLDKREGII